MLGSPILYLKGMRILMFQLSGFYCIPKSVKCIHSATKLRDIGVSGKKRALVRPLEAAAALQPPPEVGISGRV